VAAYYLRGCEGINVMENIRTLELNRTDKRLRAVGLDCSFQTLDLLLCLRMSLRIHNVPHGASRH
jgi:hypothetical protein